MMRKINEKILIGFRYMMIVISIFMIAIALSIYDAEPGKFINIIIFFAATGIFAYLTYQADRVIRAELERRHEFDYKLLARLQSDCNFYLTYGSRANSGIYFHDPKKQIKEMKRIYKNLPVKPLWCTKGDLKRFESEMLDPNR